MFAAFCIAYAVTGAWLVYYVFKCRHRMVGAMAAILAVIWLAEEMIVPRVTDDSAVAVFGVFAIVFAVTNATLLAYESLPAPERMID